MSLLDAEDQPPDPDVAGAVAAQRRVLALASGPFAQRQAAHDAAVGAKLARLRATSTATVREVAVTGDASGRAGAFVVVQSQTQAGGPPTAAAHYLKMTLTLQSGRWKVDAVQSLFAPPG